MSVLSVGFVVLVTCFGIGIDETIVSFFVPLLATSHTRFVVVIVAILHIGLGVQE